jgi:hypothetical protein
LSHFDFCFAINAAKFKVVVETSHFVEVSIAKQASEDGVNDEVLNEKANS